MESGKAGATKVKRKALSGAARRKRAIELKIAAKNSMKATGSTTQRVANLIKQVQQKKLQDSQKKLSLVPVGAGKNVKATDLRNKMNKKSDLKAIKSQAFEIVRQKLAQTIMNILPTSEAEDNGNWNNDNNQDQWNGNNNAMNDRSNWGGNNNMNNNMNMNNGGGNGGYWSSNSANVRSSNNMQGNWNNNNYDRGMQGRWNNNSNNNNNSNYNQPPMNNMGNNSFNKNFNRPGPNSGSNWNTNNNMNSNMNSSMNSNINSNMNSNMNSNINSNMNNNMNSNMNNNMNNDMMNRSVSSSGGIWSSSANSNLNLSAMKNISSNWNQQSSLSGMKYNNLNVNNSSAMNNRDDGWNSNQQNSQSNFNSNSAMWNNQYPNVPQAPRWNQSHGGSGLGNSGPNQSLGNGDNGGNFNWNNDSTNKWASDPRNAGSREYFDQMTGNENFQQNDQLNQDEYDSSSAELKFAIVDVSVPDGKIFGKCQQVLQSAFNQALADVLLNSDRRFQPIEIKFSRFIQDIFKISVASTRCVAVLQEVVNRLPVLWPGCKLRLVPYQDKVKLHKASVFIRSGAIGRSTHDILVILGRQNVGLRTELWHVFQRRQRDDGILLLVGIDQQSIDYLKRCEGRVYFLTSSVAFRLGNKKLTGPSANAGGNQSGGNQSGGNQSGGNQSGGNQSGGNQSGGNPSGGNKSGGNKMGIAKQAGFKNRNAERNAKNKNKTNK